MGGTYNIGGHYEQLNIDMVRMVCALLERRAPRTAPHEELINFVTDRPGRDRRHAVDAGKIAREPGPVTWEAFASGLESIVQRYLSNRT